MIKFFRNIRRKLASENKVSAYLRYSIGEIVLVVIGILIALSINNWNEEQKKLKIKKSYIENLINDLQKDTVQLNASLKFNINQLSTADSIMSFFNDPNTDANAVLNRYLNTPGFMGLRVINTYNSNTFNLLISSGNIDLFSNHFTNELMELNRLQQSEILVTLRNANLYFDFQNNIYSKLVTPFRVNNEKLIESLAEGKDPKEASVLFINLIIQEQHTLNRYIELTSKVKSKTEELLEQLINNQNSIKEIDEELKLQK